MNRSRRRACRTVPQPVVELREATFRLDDRLVFPKSTWRCLSNQHWAILGPNGSGKSLLADALRSRLPLVGGDLVYYFDAPGPGLAPEDAIGHVSFDERKRELHDTVLQSRWNSLEEESSLSVSEYLAYERVMEVNPFEVRPDDAPQRRAFAGRQTRALALLRTGHLLKRNLLALSNGERQRVELVRSLSRPLRLLILDEPFTGLDAQSRSELSAMLAELMKGPLRVVLVTTREEDLPAGITNILEVSSCAIAGTRVASKSRVSARRLGLQRVIPISSVSGLTDRPLPFLMRPETARTSRAGLPRPLIELRDVTVRYGDTVVLRQINWKVVAGESWALLGPNGSGKSTLLSLIAGDHPQAFNNRVIVFGRSRGDGSSVWQLKRRIGFVSPELHLHFDDNMTVLQAVASGLSGTMGLFTSPNPGQVRAARSCLCRFEMERWADTPLFTLSHGVQRMVFLARALVAKPALLLLDEPCQGLDTPHRRWILKQIDEVIRRRQATVIYVTHRLDELPPAIRRVLRLASDGTSSQEKIARSPRLGTRGARES